MRAVAGAAGLLLAAVVPSAAGARSPVVVPYPIADVWPAAVRFLRVDRGFPIREKDESSGYLLFDFLDGSKAYRASLELIRAIDEQGRDATQIVTTISDLPRHYEATLLEKLSRKVREERGTPAPPRPRKPADEPKSKDGDKPPPDAGGLPRAPTAKDLPRY